LPPGIGAWGRLEKLFLNNNALTTLPDELCAMESLQKLYVNFNKLRALPEAMGSMAALDELYAEENALTELPSSLGESECLGKLHVKRNSLTRLPASLSQCVTLEILNCDGNRLTSLPPLAALTNLKFVHLNGCALTALPAALLDAAALPELRTFDFNDNVDDDGAASLSPTILAEASARAAACIKSWSF
jgi:Leucine-rich repeat (LRR) protein